MAVKKSVAKPTKQVKSEKTKPAPVKKASSIKEPYRKTEIINHISEVTELSRKEVNLVFETLQDLITRHINKKGPKQFGFMGLFKITNIKKPATKARKARNPSTGETIMAAAKPARNVIKIRPLKKLKEMTKQ